MPDRVLFVLCTILIWCKGRPAGIVLSTRTRMIIDNLITSEVFSLVLVEVLRPARFSENFSSTDTLKSS